MEKLTAKGESNILRWQSEIPQPQTYWQQIRETDQRYFPLPWSEDNWQTVQDNPLHYDFFLMVGPEQQVHAWAIFLAAPLDPMAHLLKILVPPDLRHFGHGKKIWQSCWDFYSHQAGREGIFLEVESNNQGARNFYQKMGLHPVHEAKNYYGSGHHAVKMIRYFRD